MTGCHSKESEFYAHVMHYRGREILYFVYCIALRITEPYANVRRFILDFKMAQIPAFEGLDFDTKKRIMLEQFKGIEYVKQTLITEVKKYNESKDNNNKYLTRQRIQNAISSGAQALVCDRIPFGL